MTAQTPPFITRIIDERAELSEKIDALTVFLHSDRATDVGITMHHLMSLQLSYMTSYLRVLDARLVELGADT